MDPGEGEAVLCQSPPQSQRCEDFPDAQLRAAFSPTASVGVLYLPPRCKKYTRRPRG